MRDSGHSGVRVDLGLTPALGQPPSLARGLCLRCLSRLDRALVRSTLPTFTGETVDVWSVTDLAFGLCCCGGGNLWSHAGYCRLQDFYMLIRGIQFTL
jgi:hypothetical protein